MSGINFDKMKSDMSVFTGEMSDPSFVSCNTAEWIANINSGTISSPAPK